MVVLQSLSRSESEDFLTTSVASFVDELTGRGVDRDRAATAADDYIRQLLPDGVTTAGHRFRAIVDSDQRLGRVWCGPMPGSPNDWYIFDIEIDAGQRGRGRGRAAITTLIDEIRAAGAARVGLNVFAGNSTALALYESLGFQATSTSDSGHEMWLAF